MAKVSSRTQRVSDVVHRELMSLITREFRDPRVGMVTVTEVAVSRDLSFGRVYVTILEEDKREISLKILNDAAGFFRSHLAQSLKLRTTPKLKFIYDASVEEGQRMEQLIDRALRS